MDDLVRFMQKALPFEGEAIEVKEEKQFALMKDGFVQLLFTTDREEANNTQGLHLFGLDHPAVSELLEQYRSLAPELIAFTSDHLKAGEILSFWEIKAENEKGHSVHSVLKLAVDIEGNRLPKYEKISESIFVSEEQKAAPIVNIHDIETVLERELLHKNIIKSGQAYSAKLITLACG